MTNEQIAELKRIVDGAPETAIEVCLYDYGDSEQITYLNCESQFYDDEEEFKWVDMELVDDFFHSRRRLSDIRTIIAQHEEIERLRNPWISVEDELPSIEGDRSRSVLIRRVYKNGTVSFTTSFLWSEAKKMSFSFNEPHWQTDIWNAQESNGYTVTHWMPLPQPPKGESDEC